MRLLWDDRAWEDYLYWQTTFQGGFCKVFCHFFMVAVAIGIVTLIKEIKCKKQI